MKGKSILAQYILNCEFCAQIVAKMKKKSPISQFPIFAKLISFKTIKLNRISIFFRPNSEIIVHFSEFGRQIFERPYSKVEILFYVDSENFMKKY